MKTVNARVMECGLPMKATYLGTHTDGTKHYMEIRYHGRQSRKWISADKVTLHEGVEIQYCEKVSELV